MLLLLLACLLVVLEARSSFPLECRPALLLAEAPVQLQLQLQRSRTQQQLLPVLRTLLVPVHSPCFRIER